MWLTRIPHNRRLMLDELLPAVDIVSAACKGRVGHYVHGERGYVGRPNDAPDRQRSAELFTAGLKLIAEQRCRQWRVHKPSSDEVDANGRDLGCQIPR